MSICDNTSVGVLITDSAGRYLMIRRVRPPVGIAPPAGHTDEHGTHEAAAVAEVHEEVGLTVTGLHLIMRLWRANRCRRTPGPLGVGHLWSIYRAEVSGEVTCDPAETAEPRWYTPDEIQALADRTVAHARHEVSDAEFTAAPGLEPVWLQVFVDLAVIRVDAADLTDVNVLAHRPA